MKSVIDRHIEIVARRKRFLLADVTLLKTDDGAVVSSSLEKGWQICIRFSRVS